MVIAIAGVIMIVEGLLKSWKPELKFLRMGLPCGGGLVILGTGLLLLGLGV